MFKRLYNILWWILMAGICIYCTWLFFDAVDAYLNQQMSFYSQNLGI